MKISSNLKELLKRFRKHFESTISLHQKYFKFREMNNSCMNSLKPGVLGIYDIFGNFFHLKTQIGHVYLVPEELVDSMEDKNLVFFRDSYYTCTKRDGLSEVPKPSLPLIKRIVNKAFVQRLRKRGYKFASRYIVYHPENEHEQPNKEVFRIFDGFEYRIVILKDNLYLCVNPHLVFQTSCTVKDLSRMGIDPKGLCDFSVKYLMEESSRIDGYLIETFYKEKNLLCRIKNYREFREDIVKAESVIPEPKPELLQQFLDLLEKNFDIINFQRELSFLNSKTASRDRFSKTLEMVNNLQKDVFPLEIGDFKVSLEAEPIVVKL